MDRSAVAGWEGPAAVPGSLRVSAEEEGPNIPAPSARRGEVSICPPMTQTLRMTPFLPRMPLSLPRGLPCEWSLPRRTTKDSGMNHKT